LFITSISTIARALSGLRHGGAIATLDV